jgi:hypothetical protein
MGATTSTCSLCGGPITWWNGVWCRASAPPGGATHAGRPDDRTRTQHKPKVVTTRTRLLVTIIGLFLAAVVAIGWQTIATRDQEPATVLWNPIPAHQEYRCSASGLHFTEADCVAVGGAWLQYTVPAIRRSWPT